MRNIKVSGKSLCVSIIICLCLSVLIQAQIKQDLTLKIPLYYGIMLSLIVV